MSKKANYEQLSTTISPQFNKLLRLQAFKGETSLGEMLELYQQAYIEKLEREKNEKKLAKEIKEKGEIICPQCEQKVYYNR